MAVSTSSIVASVHLLRLVVEPFQSVKEHDCSIAKEVNFMNVCPRIDYYPESG